MPSATNAIFCVWPYFLQPDVWPTRSQRPCRACRTLFRFKDGQPGKVERYGYRGTSIDTVTVVSPTGASNHTSYIPFLRQRGEASTGGCLGTSMASNGLNLAELRGLVY